MTFAFFALAATENDSTWPLFVCAIMTLALLVYIFRTPREMAHGTEKTRVSFLKERKEQVYENLRDLNFEYKAGKLPEADYQQMRASLEDDAATLLAEIEQLESGERVAVTLRQPNTKGARS